MERNHMYSEEVWNKIVARFQIPKWVEMNDNLESNYWHNDASWSWLYKSHEFDENWSLILWVDTPEKSAGYMYRYQIELTNFIGLDVEHLSLQAGIDTSGNSCGGAFGCYEGSIDFGSDNPEAIMGAIEKLYRLYVAVRRGQQISPATLKTPADAVYLGVPDYSGD